MNLDTNFDEHTMIRVTYIETYHIKLLKNLKYLACESSRRPETRNFFSFFRNFSNQIIDALFSKISISLYINITVAGSYMLLAFCVPVARSRAPSFLAPMFFFVLRGICDMCKFLYFNPLFLRTYSR